MADQSTRRGRVAAAEALHPDMRSPDEELQVRHKALKAARKKAMIEARVAREEDRRVQMEEYKMLRVYPAKCFVAAYFLKERSGGMICRDQWYRYGIPEDKEDPEVTLQLWEKRSGKEARLRGEVGDLYSLEIELPSGTTLDLNIIVQSFEAKKDPSLRMQYSIYDLGHDDKAYSVDKEAWQNYLIFRDESNKEDLDCRLLYHAVCNKYEVGDVSLVDFARFQTSSILMLMQGMMVGGDYPRPSVHDAMLATEPPAPEPTAEVLRAQEEEDAELEQQVADKMDTAIKKKFGRRPSFKEIVEYEEMVANNLGYSPSKRKLKNLKKKRLNPYPRRDALRFHPDDERVINRRLNKFLDEFINQDNATGSNEDPSHHISINDVDDPIATLEFVNNKLKQKQQQETTPPNSPKTLKSWSGSGWASDNDGKSKDSLGEEATICQLDEDGRIMEGAKVDKEGTVELPTLPKLKPEVSWEASYNAQKAVNLVLTESWEERHDETVASLLSSLSGMEVLDRSSELESNPEEVDLSSDNARDTDGDDPISTTYDSVEVFLAKKPREEDIITLESSSSTSPDDTTPDDEPEEGTTRSSPGREPRRGPGEFSFMGTRYRWKVPAQVAHYPGGYVDDLAFMGIPTELWPFPVDGANKDDPEEEDNNPEANCECNHDEKND